MRRRFSSTDGLLLLTVVIWSLNITVTKYILTHGLQPLAYAAVRYGIATAIFAAITYVLERSFRIGGRRQLVTVGIAAAMLLANQVCLVYSLRLANATTVALILGTMPIFTGLFSSLTGIEHPTRRFWLAAGVSFGGVALVAVGAGSSFTGELGGVLVAMGMSATWAAYSVAIAPLMREYSPYRISTAVLVLMWLPLVLLASKQLSNQEWDLDWLVWAGLAFAIVGPLILTNVLWFTAVHRVGPGRATLFSNLQPFLGALFAVVLLSEPLTVSELFGGALIAAAIFLAGPRSTPPATAE